MLEHVRGFRDTAHVGEAAANEVDELLEGLGGRARAVRVHAHAHGGGERVFAGEVVDRDDVHPTAVLPCNQTSQQVLFSRTLRKHIRMTKKGQKSSLKTERSA